MDDLTKIISRGIVILYKLRHYVTRKILTNVYYAIIYPFLLYGITIWGSASNILLIPLHILQKKFVRLATLLMIHKVAMEEVQHVVKYLVVLIDSQLTFKYHIDESNRKVSRANRCFI